MTETTPTMDDRGLPSSVWLETLNEQALLDWVSNRLRGLDPYFPLRDGDETRGELFLHVTDGLAPANTMNQRLGTAVALFFEVLCDQAEPDPVTFEETAYCFGEMATANLMPKVRGALDAERFKETHWRRHDLDMALLVALSHKGGVVERAFWDSLLDDARLMEIALVAIQNAYSVDDAIDALVKRIDLFKDNPDETDLELALDYILRGGAKPQRIVDRLDALQPVCLHKEFVLNKLRALGHDLSGGDDVRHASRDDIEAIMRVLLKRRPDNMEIAKAVADASIARNPGERSSIRKAQANRAQMAGA